MAHKTMTVTAGDYAYGSWSNSYVISLTLTQEQMDTAASTSQVSYLFTISNTDNNRFVANGYNWAISIGAQSIPIQNFNFALGTNHTTQTIASGQITVQHNADGSCSLPYAVSIPNIQSWNEFGPPEMTLSGAWPLEGIPTAPALLSAPNFTDEDDPVIRYTNPAGAAASHFQACICNEDGTQIYAPYRDIPKTGSEYTFSLTEEERTALQNATPGQSRKVKFVIWAVVNGAVWYPQLIRTMQLINAQPLIAADVVDTNSATVALTGNSNTLVKFFSSAATSAIYGAQKGAEIESYRVSLGNRRASENPYTFHHVESGEFTFTVKDSRGYTTDLQIGKSMVEYIKLTCNIAESTPSVTGEMTLSVFGNFFNGSFGARSNELTVQYRYKAGSGSYCDWITMTPAVSGNAYRAEGLITGLDYRKIYTFQARATDCLDQVTGRNYITRALPVFDWGESDFNVNGAFKVNGVQMTDHVIEEGTQNYWRYRKWASGFAECWLHITLGAVDIASPWGALYESPEQTGFAFPFSFTALKTCITSASHETAGLLLKDQGGPSNAASQNFTLVSGSALGRIYNVNVRVYAAGTYL